MIHISFNRKRSLMMISSRSQAELMNFTGLLLKIMMKSLTLKELMIEKRIF
jgi:hypothetical protein